MPQSKERKAQYQKERRGLQRGTSNEGTSLGGTSDYPPIIHAITDPVKRKKLEAICESLDNHKLLSKVYYGAGAHSVDFGTVSDLLAATA